MGCFSTAVPAPERQVLKASTAAPDRTTAGFRLHLQLRGVVHIGIVPCRTTAHPRGAAYESAVRVSRAAYETTTNVFHAVSECLKSVYTFGMIRNRIQCKVESTV